MSRQPSIKQLSQAVDMYLASRKAPPRSTRGGVSDFGGVLASLPRSARGGAMCGGAACCKQCGGYLSGGVNTPPPTTAPKELPRPTTRQLNRMLARNRDFLQPANESEPQEQRQLQPQPSPLDGLTREQMAERLRQQLEQRRQGQNQGAGLDLQPRPKRGGELTVPRRVQPANSFFGAGVSGGRMRRLAGMGVSGGAGGSSWVQHVKRVAAQEGISYKDALKVASESYRGGAACGGAFMGTMSDPVGDRHL